MNELELFLSKINAICKDHAELSIESSREIINEINSFLYTTYPGIGEVSALNTKYDYFSDFHKYWEKHHKEILNIQVNRSNCERVADILHDVFLKTNGKVFSDLYDTNGLREDEICRVRFLTANQDFRGSRDFSDLSKIYKNDPDIFTADYIVENPEDFLKKIKITDLSQTDKRIKYAKTIGHFLIERQLSSPYDLLAYYRNDVFALRQDMINCMGAGYGNKKTDMFIRDMIILGVWKNVIGFDKIDVASDINTIKVALRTGIMTCEIPLLSSFLDIFCYQYGYVAEMNAKAWRTVWEIWNQKYEEKIESPSLLDFFIYRIVGREFCKVNLYTYQCEKGHTFLWNTQAKSVCPECKGKVTVIDRRYMCDAQDGSVVTERLLPQYKNCPFKDICDKNDKKKLQPPKSISILGQTGWTSAYTETECGGGGLMA